MSNSNTAFGFEKISEILSLGEPHIRFLGIGGVSMYSLALLSLARGMRVSGYDKECGKYCKTLLERGVSVSNTPDFATVSTATLVVYSLAIDEADTEFVYAGSLGIPRVSRADFLSYLMADYTYSVAVSGTHGKSTVSAMLHEIFSAAGKAPSSLLGAELSSGEPFSLGGRELFLYESCEYRDSFLCMRPNTAVITNVEYDHPDYFKDEAAVVSSFLKCINRAKDIAILPLDDKNVRSILDEIKVPYLTYGVSAAADYSYAIDAFLEGGSRFTLYHENTPHSYEIRLIGAHNAANAVCAAVTALAHGIPSEIIKEALFRFKAPSRRLEEIGEYRGRRVFYDYAHHPTEISAAIGALRSWSSEPITVVFRPHTYSRTKALWDSFVLSLSLADSVILTDIYAAREEPIFDITSERLAKEIGERAAYIADGEILGVLDKTRGDIILMGAGEVENIKRLILGK